MLRIKDPKIFAGMGGLALATGLLIERFATEFALANFLVGMFIGMSLVFNIKFLLMWRTENARKPRS